MEDEVQDAETVLWKLMPWFTPCMMQGRLTLRIVFRLFYESLGTSQKYML